MLAQTCPMTTLAVVNVDAEDRPKAPAVHDCATPGRIMQNRAGPVPDDNVGSGQRRWDAWRPAWCTRDGGTSATGGPASAGCSARAGGSVDSPFTGVLADTTSAAARST